MKTRLYDHNGGKGAVGSAALKRITGALERVSLGAHESSAPALKKGVLRELHRRGWSDRVRLGSESGISITSMCGDVALCLQLGNISRIYADLLKLEVMFRNGRAECAVFLIPTQEAALSMGRNMANFERLTRELPLFGDIITVPIAVIGMHEEDT